MAEFVDDGRSAWSGEARPGFLALVDAVRARAFDVVLAVAEDRLTRSSEAKIGFQAECVRADVTWHTTSGGKVDPSTAEGGLLATITGALAEYESSIKADRVARSVERRLADGKDLGGRRPFGWEADRQTIRETEASLIRQGTQMILDGGSVYSVAAHWTASGLPSSGQSVKWRTQTVRSILLRPRNAGRLVVKGVDYGQSFPPIVAPDDHERVVAILSNPARAPRRGPKPMRHTATGLVRCGICGSYLQQTGLSRGGRRALRCAGEGRDVPAGARHPTIDADKMEGQLAEIALVRVLTLVARGERLTDARPEVSVVRMEIADLVRRRDVQQELAAAPGVNLRKAIQEIGALGLAIEAAQTKLERLLGADATAEAVTLARDFVEHLDDGRIELDPRLAAGPWSTYWSGQDVERRRTLLRGLVESIELLPFERGVQSRLRVDGFEPPIHEQYFDPTD